MLDSYTGCLIGGAIGDALGAPIEFMSWREITSEYGDKGIDSYVSAYGRLGAITDDTQMTLFTAEGLLCAQDSYSERTPDEYALSIYKSYLRWVLTQNRISMSQHATNLKNGYLYNCGKLNHERAPGVTCVTSLVGDKMGFIGKGGRLNDSKGCGGVMRAAPVGIFFHALAKKNNKKIDYNFVYDIGCRSAAITHGNAVGYESAGCFAVMIAKMLDGGSIEDSFSFAIKILKEHNGSYDCRRKFDYVSFLVENKNKFPNYEAIRTLGGGWTGEEAFAVGVYSNLVSDSFDDSIITSVNHSGDSDSTGLIAGSIAGIICGFNSFKGSWLSALELKDEICTIATDLESIWEDNASWREKYPLSFQK